MKHIAIVMVSFLLMFHSAAQMQQDTALSFTGDQADSTISYSQQHKKSRSKHGGRKAWKEEDRPGRMLRQAWNNYQQKKYGAASEKFMDILQWSRQNNHRPAEAQALEGLGLTCFAFQDAAKSDSLLQQALQMNKELDNYKEMVRICKSISDIKYSKGSFDAALYYAGRSLQLAAGKEMTHEIQLARLSALAAYIRLKNWQEADRLIGILRNTSELLSDPDLFVQFHSLLGNYYAEKGQMKNSRLHYNSAVAKAQEQKAPHLFAIAYGNQIDSWLGKGDYQKAADCFEQFKTIRNTLQQEDNKATVFQADLYKNEINYLNMEKKLDNLQLEQKAKESLLKDGQLKQDAKERNRLERNLRVKDSIVVLNDSLIHLHDSLHHREKLLRIAQERENGFRMEREKAERDLKIKEARQLAINLAIGLGTTLLLGSIILWQYSKQKRKNAIIKNQNEDLKILMKEIHHRVKNNLQVISSLLDLQAHTVGNSQASEAIREGKNRVRSMALIHQNLYGERNIQKIKVKAYIHSLAQDLLASYHTAKGSINIQTDIDDLDLDVDTVVPLGLIINELISNSLKHAFKNGPGDNIHLVLKEQDGLLILKVKDNGKGFIPVPSLSAASFGMKLIKAFAAKLKAKMEMYNEEGACVVLHIHKYKPVL